MKSKKYYKNPFTSEEKLIDDWCEYLGISKSCWFTRKKVYGLKSPRMWTTGKKVLPEAKQFKHPINGEIENAQTWSKRLNITVMQFYKRIKRYGENHEKVFTRNLSKHNYAKILVTHPETKEVKSLEDWADYYKVTREAMIYRYRTYTEINRILCPPIQPTNKSFKRYMYKGVRYTLRELSRKFNLSPSGIRYRIKNNIPLDISAKEAKELRREEYLDQKHQRKTKDPNINPIAQKAALLWRMPNAVQDN